LAPEAGFFGMGGERMQAAGCELLVNANEVAVVGLVEVVKHLPAIRRRFKHLVAEAARRKPDAAVLIDFPDFNLRLARELHRLGIPVFYFVSPQIWAWRTGRVKQIQKYVRKMIVIFPFEQEFYRRHGVEVSYVGHPLAHAPVPQVSRPAFAAQYGLDPAKEWIALLPGSRRREVRLNLPAILGAIDLLRNDLLRKDLLRKQGTDYEYLLPVASTLSRDWMREQLAASVTHTADIKLTENARVSMMLARASVVASGTATVEAALSGTPFVVVYRLAPLTWILGRRLVRLDTFAMPNLIAGRKIVPELIQREFTPKSVLRELNAILPDSPARRQMQNDLKEVQGRLVEGHLTEDPLRQPPGAEAPVQRAAREILAALAAGKTP
ncbi:MAG: lipid-A-disaccharide synthase, partial [Terriglobales bacterium]